MGTASLREQLGELLVAVYFRSTSSALHFALLVVFRWTSQDNCFFLFLFFAPPPPSSFDSPFLSSLFVGSRFLGVNCPSLLVVDAHLRMQFANVLAGLCDVEASAALPDSRRVRRQILERLTADSFPPTRGLGRSYPAAMS